MEAILTPIKLSAENLKTVDNETLVKVQLDSRLSSAFNEGMNSFGLRANFLHPFSLKTKKGGASVSSDDKDTMMSDEDQALSTTENTPRFQISRAIKKSPFAINFSSLRAPLMESRSNDKSYKKMTAKLLRRQTPQVGGNAFGVRPALKTFKTRLIVVDGQENKSFSPSA